MPIQFPAFRPLSFEEANPELTGARATLGLVGQNQQLISDLLAQRKAAAELPYAGELAKSTAAYKTAMANYLTSPNQMLKNLTPLGKSYVEPGIVGALTGGSQYGYGSTQGQAGDFGSMMPTEPGTENEIQQTYARERGLKTTDPVLRRQAQSAQELYNEISDINTKPLEEFSGLGGRGKMLKEKLKTIGSSLGYETKPSKEWRDYQTFVNTNKYLIIDQLRKALQTSIMPSYVNQTFAPMLSPESPMWSDPEQVRNVIDSMKHWSKNYAQSQTQAMQKGVPGTLEEARSRHMSSLQNNEFGEKNRASNKEIDEIINRGNKTNNVPGDQGYLSVGEGQQTIEMITPDGKRWNVPVDKLQAAVDAGARQVIR